jgi:ketosteroid isomerase-like protein
MKGRIMPPADKNEIRQAIAAVLETYRLAFINLDAHQLESIWDFQHEPLIYLAQEKEEPIFGWDGIQKYYAALPEHLEKVLSKNLDEVKIDVAGETAIAFFTSRAIVKLKGRSDPYEPIGHVTMIFHRTSNGWRAIQYHESARSEQSAQVMREMKAMHAG